MLTVQLEIQKKESITPEGVPVTYNYMDYIFKKYDPNLD